MDGAFGKYQFQSVYLVLGGDYRFILFALPAGDLAGEYGRWDGLVIGDCAGTGEDILSTLLFQ